MRFINTIITLFFISFLLYIISQIIVINSYSISIIELSDILFLLNFITFSFFCLIAWPIIIAVSYTILYINRKTLNIDLNSTGKKIRYVLLPSLVSVSLVSKYILVFCISYIGYGFLSNIDVRKINTNELVASGDLIIQTNRDIRITSVKDNGEKTHLVLSSNNHYVSSK